MPNVPDLHRFLVSYWVANPITYDLKQVSSYGLVISFWNSSVGVVGFEPTQAKPKDLPSFVPLQLYRTPIKTSYFKQPPGLEPATF